MQRSEIMSRYLMINADDFGGFACSNAAVMDLLTDEKSALTSSTVMAPCAWAPQACRFAAKNPDLAIGVHLTLTSEWHSIRWAPVAQGDTSSLRDKEGYMHHSTLEVEKNAHIAQINAEIRAQVARCRALGMTNPSHLDNHMGSLYGIATGRFELMETALAFAAELRLPFRLPASVANVSFANTMLGIATSPDETIAAASKAVDFCKTNGVALPDHLIPGEWGGEQDKSYENFRDYLYNLYESIPEGVTESYLHPALECDELKTATGAWHRRVWEYRIMKDPATRKHIEAHGIKLINYRDLAKM